MNNVERIRELLSAPLTADHLDARLKEGWRPIAIEWEREAGEPEPMPARPRQEVPYGLRVSEDCRHLEDDPTEKEALKLMLALIAGDQPLSRVASELNREGYRTRSGPEWTQVAVFNMLPRLIEVAPEIFSAEEWTVNKHRILQSV